MLHNKTKRKMQKQIDADRPLSPLVCQLFLATPPKDQMKDQPTP